MEKFNHNVDLLGINVKLFNDKLPVLDKFVVKMTDIMNIYQEIDKYVSILDSTLHTIDGVLVAISVITQIKNEVDVIDKIIKELTVVVDCQKNNIENFNQYVKPVMEQFNNFHDKINDITTETNNLDNDIIIVKNKLSGVSDKHLADTLAIGCNLCLEIINTSMSEFVKIIDGMQNAINSIEKKFSFFTTVINDIKYLLGKLHIIDTVTAPVNKMLDHTITIPCSDNNRESVTHNFMFTVGKILRGINGIIDEVIDELNKETNKILDPVLKEFDLGIDLPKMTSLENVGNEIQELTNSISLDNLNLMNTYFDSITTNIRHIRADFH